MLHIFELFFQGKGIGDRELSIWRIVFGMGVTFAGVLFLMDAMLVIFAKAVEDVLKVLASEEPDGNSEGTDTEVSGGRCIMPAPGVYAPVCLTAGLFQGESEPITRGF